ncbi:GNAT family protein [Variovorax rhizosphaerae]|uniref:GNAT family protein n=1 Tax=Variovorax rhizosphaerae TaxID=1836200 RepID=A0ABU8WP59_9BURK
MNIRRLLVSDAPAVQALRLAGLLEAPTAFGSSHEEEKDWPTSVVATLLQHGVDLAFFGAFRAQSLIGAVAFDRERVTHRSHKGLIWGMYVLPDYRSMGVARALLAHLLAFAADVPGVRQLNATVNSGNAIALRLFESFGFRAFGVEPDAMFIAGQFHSETHLCLHLSSTSTR